MHEANTTDTIEIIDNHLDQFVLEDEIVVFHESETKKGQNHIDIYWLKQNPEYRPFNILLTCGMSRYPMVVPAGYEGNEYLEAAMLIPQHWTFENLKTKSDKITWPIYHLQGIAHLIDGGRIWLGIGNSINSKINDCFLGTNFCCSVLLNSKTLPTKFRKIKNGDNVINILSAIPLYSEELAFKKEYGSNALLDKFQEHETGEILDLDRTNVCE